MPCVSDYGSDPDDVDGIPNDYIGDDQLDEGLGESDARSYYNEDPGECYSVGIDTVLVKTLMEVECHLRQQPATKRVLCAARKR